MLAVAILAFDDAARETSLISTEAAQVFGDIASFTDVQPTPLPLLVG